LELTFTSSGLTSAVDTTSITITAGTANKLVMKTSPSSSVAAGAAFGTQPAVYVEDSYGNVVTGDSSTVVTATVGTGTGPLTGTLAATTSGGTATFSGLAAPTLAQSGLELTFTGSGLTSAVDTTSITITAATANKLVFTTHPGGATAGSAFGTQPVVKTQDAYGNLSCVGLGSNLSVTLAVKTGTGALLGTTRYDIGTAHGNGTITGSGMHLDQAGAFTLSATASGVTEGDSGSFTVQSLYQAWLVANGGAADTEQNCMSYACGLAPGVLAPTISYTTAPAGVTRGIPMIYYDQARWRVVFGRRAGVTYTLQFRATLNNTSEWVTYNGPVDGPLATDGVIEVMSAPFPNSIPTSKGPRKPTFFRMGVQDSGGL